jgi:hypothetical protein
MAKRFVQNTQKSAPTPAKAPPTPSPETPALPKPPAAPSSKVCPNTGVTDETVAAKAKTPSLRLTLTDGATVTGVFVQAQDDAVVLEQSSGTGLQPERRSYLRTNVTRVEVLRRPWSRGKKIGLTVAIVGGIVAALLLKVYSGYVS